MIQLIYNEWGIDENAQPVKLQVYLAGVNDTLPKEASVGSRVIFDDGSKALMTPSGWQKG